MLQTLKSIAIRHLSDPALRQLRRLAAPWRPREPELALIPALARDDRAFLDVGANKGAYLEAALGRFAAIYAVEPSPRMSAYLRAAFGARIEVLELALSDRPGTLPLYVPTRAGRPIASRASLEATANPGFAQDALSVVVRRLDELPLPPLGLVKIDVEGHERAVLEGGRDRLARDRPALLVEIEERHHAGGSQAIVARLRGWGYEPLFLDGARLRPLGERPLAELQRADAKHFDARRRRGSGYINNFLFLHRDDTASRDRLRAAGQLD